MAKEKETITAEAAEGPVQNDVAAVGAVSNDSGGGNQLSAPVDGVTVRMFCVLSGHPDNPGPNDTVTVDADEADRLIELGVAEKV